MPARPGRRDSCGPRFLTTTSWLPSTSSTCSAMRCCALRIDDDRLRARRRLRPRARWSAAARRARRTAALRSPTRVGAARRRPASTSSRRGAAHDLDQRRRHGDGAVAAAQHHHLRHRGRQRQHQLEAGALAGGGGGLDAAAHRDTSERTTSMPTPRPASSVTVSAVEKPGVKIRLASSASLVLGVRRRAGPSRAPLSRMRAQVRGRRRRRGTRRRLRCLRGDSATMIVPVGSLPAARARLGRLDAVRDAVAQQVLEGAGHAVEHAAVDFDRAADDVEPHLLAGFLGGLADDAVQAVGQAFELDHARAQQVVLQVARQARLRGQLVFGRLAACAAACAARWRRR